MIFYNYKVTVSATEYHGEFVEEEFIIPTMASYLAVLHGMRRFEEKLGHSDYEILNVRVRIADPDGE